MLSSKVFITDRKTKIFNSDFEITSSLHGRVLSSVNGIIYLNVDASLWFVSNNAFIFYIAPTYSFLKIIVATNPDELFTVEIDSQLEDLENLVGENEVIVENIENNVAIIEGINQEIQDALTSVNNTKNAINLIYTNVQNALVSVSNSLTQSGQNLSYITAKIDIVNILKTDATEKLTAFETLLSGYNNDVTAIQNKINELNGYKTIIESI